MGQGIPMAPEASATSVGVGAFGLADVEERDSGVVLALSDAVGARRCACGAVTLGDEIVHREGGCRPMTRLRIAVERQPFPAPEVTSRDPWNGVKGAPGPVLKLAESARAASWIVGVQRSRGCAPHAAHGAPGALKWRFAVRLRREGAAAYAVHDGVAWKSVMLWGAARTVFPLASVTDLVEYIRAGGTMGDAWYDAIRERVRTTGERKKMAARSRPKTSREGMS